MHHHYAAPGLEDTQYSSILSHLNILKMNIDEAVAKVNELTGQVNKIAGEVTNVKDQLAAALAAGKEVPQELQDAIGNLGAAVQGVDDLNADAPQA